MDFNWEIVQIVALFEVFLIMITSIKNWFNRFLMTQFDLKSAQHQLLFSSQFATKEELHELREELNSFRDNFIHGGNR